MHWKYCICYSSAMLHCGYLLLCQIVAKHTRKHTLCIYHCCGVCSGLVLGGEGAPSHRLSWQRLCVYRRSSPVCVRDIICLTLALTVQCGFACLPLPRTNASPGGAGRPGFRGQEQRRRFLLMLIPLLLWMDETYGSSATRWYSCNREELRYVLMTRTLLPAHHCSLPLFAPHNRS